MFWRPILQSCCRQQLPQQPHKWSRETLLMPRASRSRSRAPDQVRFAAVDARPCASIQCPLRTLPQLLVICNWSRLRSHADAAAPGSLLVTLPPPIQGSPTADQPGLQGVLGTRTAISCSASYSRRLEACVPGSRCPGHSGSVSNRQDLIHSWPSFAVCCWSFMCCPVCLVLESGTQRARFDMLELPLMLVVYGGHGQLCQTCN